MDFSDFSMGQAFKTDGFAFLPVDPETMAARVMQFAPATDAEALKILRSSFPDCPLSARVAALDYLMRRKPRSLRAYAQPYLPR
jgi:hypothetical protein